MNFIELKQLINTAAGLYDFFLKGDMDQINKVFDPKYEQIPPQKPGLEPGVENFMKAYQEGFGSMFSNLKGEITHVVQNGDLVSVRGEYTMEHTGEAFGVPATNKIVKFTAFDLHQIKNGKIIKTWHLEDFFSIMTQVKSD